MCQVLGGRRGVPCYCWRCSAAGDAGRAGSKSSQERPQSIQDAPRARGCDLGAERIKIVAKARAEAESKRLQGQGIADQRREIARGLEESVDVLNNVGINSQEASALIVVTQHYDTLQSIGEETNTNLILLPNSPQAGSNMLNDMIASFVASNKIGEEMKKQNEARGITPQKTKRRPPSSSGYDD